MENLRSLEPQAKISHSYKKKECIVALRISKRNREIKKLFQPHSGRYSMNEATLFPFCSN